MVSGAKGLSENNLFLLTCSFPFFLRCIPIAIGIKYSGYSLPIAIGMKKRKITAPLLHNLFPDKP